MRSTWHAAWLALILSCGLGREALAYTPGKDGTLNIAADTVVNTYTPLVVAAGAGDTTITVENAATLGATPGDVLMIYQAQGATIDGTNAVAFGNVSALGNAGRFEFVNVVSVAGNVIRISDACSPGLRFAYSGAATAVPPAVQAFRAQVIRVPQYVNLNINAGGRLLPQAWNGSTGGVVAVFVQGTAAINGNGIVASGRGFRGGLLDNVTTATGTDVTLYRGTLSDNGGEKGESIAGYQAQYDVAAIGGRYGRGAPANGGGGGNAHNAGGGGGANHGAIASWNNGQGNPDTTTASWNAAWLLDPTLGCTNVPSFGCPVRSGGGRGGYTYGSSNQNALTLAPGGAAWGGNLRRERGGLGGRPLLNDPALANSRLFLGGGGGAGDGNNGAASSGAAGGGLVFLVANSVTGAGPIAAVGATATDTLPGHNDAPGGGGGGGSIVVVANTYAGPALNAAGGNAGNQLITGAESEGPGGGGGGGYIAVLPAGSVPAVAAVAAGANGRTDSSALTEFIPNGATRGAAGATAVAPAVSGMAICPVSQADLSIAKSDGGASVVPGTNLSYTLSVSNLGPAAATSLTVSDTIPAGLGFVSASGTGWACGQAAGVVTCTRASLAVGAAPAIALVLSVPAGYSGANPIPNTATVAATTSDPAGGNNSGSDTTPVAAAQADLAITKSDGGANAVLGGSISYTLSVQNLGPSNAAGLSVTDTIPAGLTFGSASGTGWTCGQVAGVVTCTRAALAAGATAPAITLVLNVPVGYAGANPIPNSATIASGSIDPVGGNNTGSDTTPLLAPPNLALGKSDGGASVAPGGTATYTLSYSNSSSSAANGVVLTDTVPANTSFNPGASTAGWSCVPDNNAGSTCTLAVGSVAGGASGSATFAVTVAASVPAGVTSIANSAIVSDDGTGGPDPTPGDNTGSDTTPVNAAPDLTVVKSDGGATVAPGGTVTYTLSYDNNGNQGATGVVLTETVPTHTTFNPGASTPGWACVPNNNAGATCTITIGALPALTGGGRIFALTVVNPVPSGVTQVANTASVADDGSNGPDPTPGNNSGSDTTPVDAAPDLAVTKSDGGASVVPGTSVSYTLSYANNGNQDAVGVVITDVVPANTAFNAGASTAGWACVPDINAGSTCTLAIGALAAGSNGSATFTVDVPANLPGSVTQIANSAVGADDGSNGPDPTPGDNTGSDTTPVAPPSADVSIVKDDAGASVVPGNNLSYTLSVSNAGPSEASALTVTDTIPAGLGFVSATGTGWTCGEAAGLVTCTRATLPLLGVAPAITLVLNVPANYAGANPILNSAAVATTSSDPNPGNNTDGESTPVSAPQADLSMAKDDGGASVTPGANVTYTLAVGNAGPSAAAGVSVTDTVPAGLVFVSATGTGWTCGEAAGVVTCTRATLAVGAAPAITLVLGVPANYSGANPIFNSATVASTTTDPAPGNDTDGDTTPVDPPSADLLIVKDDAGVSVTPGNDLTYTLAVSNAGLSDATAVSVTDTIPAGLAFVSASGAGWTCGEAAGLVTCTRATLAVGAAPVITLVVAVPPGYAGANPILNSGSVSSGTADPTPGNNTDGESTPVNAPSANLSLLKDDGGATVVPGDNLSYTLSVANAGPSTATAVSVSDTIPAGLGFVSAGGTGWTCGQAAGVVTCTRPTLAVGPAPAITLVLGVPANYSGANPIVNAATVTSTTSDPTPGDDTGSDTTPVAPPSADLSLLKDDAGASVTPGTNLTYTLSVANAGPSDAASVSVTDTIPAALSFVSATGTGWICGEAAGLVTCTRATLAVGAAPAITLVVGVPANYAGANPILNSGSVAATTADPAPGNNTDGESTPVNAASADLNVSKDDGGATVVPGNNVSYTLSVANVGPSDATAISVTDTIPAGLGFVSAAGAGWTCGQAAGVVTCTRPTLAVGAAPAITLVLSVPANYAGANPIVNSTTVASTTSDPTPGDNTDSDTTPVSAPSADLNLIKDDAGATVVPGTSLTYTLAVANAGPSDASALSVTDTIPAGLTFVSATGAGWTCGEVAGLVTCTRATLPVGAAPVITLVLGVPAGFAGADPILNSANVAASTADPTPGDNTDGENTPLAAPQSDLAIAKDDGGASVTPGGNVSYALSVENLGPSQATGVSVTDTIPAGLGFVSATGAGWTCGQAAGVVTCTRATLALGTAPSITLVLGVPSNYAGANPIVNSSSVASTSADPVPGNNTDGDTTPVNAPSADLNISKDDGGASVTPGNNLSYTLSVANVGPSDAAAVSVTDTIPAGLGFVSAAGAGWTCGQAAGVVTCTRPTLAVGPAPAITLVLGVPANYAGANPILNSTTVASTTADPTPGDNTDSDTTPVNAPSADLNLAKDDGGATVVPGTNVTYTLSVANVGPSDASSVSVTDTIPAGLNFVSASGAGWTCGQAAGVVTCTRPTLAVGAAPAITLVLGVPANYSGANPILNSATVASTTSDPTPGDNTGSDTTPVAAPSADLNIAKDDGGASVVPGTNVSYTLSVANVGPSDAAAVSVTDTIPAGLGFVSASGAGWTCGQAAGVVTCTRATLAVGAAPAITLVLGVPANYAGANPIVNSSTVASTTSDPTPGDNTDSDTTPVNGPQSDLSIVKDDAGASVTPGTNLTYTLSVANAGPSDAATLSVTDTIPAGLGFVSATGAGWTCGEAAGLVTCTRPTLAVGAAPVITLVVSVPANYAGANPILNSASVTSASTDPTPGDNTDGESTPVNAASADLNVSKDDGGATVVPGNNVSYTLSVANVGPSDATAVSVTDTIPAGLGFVSASGAGWTCGQAAGVVTCTRPTLAVGAAPAITLVLSVPANYAGANPIVNSTTVASTTGDPTPGDNTDSDTTPVGPNSADLAIAKDDGGVSVVPGNNVTYTLDVTNLGPSDASGLSVTDTVPAGLTFVSASGAGWTCGEAAGVVSCTRTALAVGPAPAISVVFGVPAGYTGANPIVNSATVAATTADPTPGNNTDGDTTPVGASSADLAIAKDDGGASVVPGNDVTYTLAVSNLGPSDASSLSVTDSVPAGLTFVSASGAGWTCGQTAGVVTCTRPTLAVGPAPDISVVFNVPSGYAGANPIVNSATVAATTADPTPDNNTDGDTTPVGAGSADLSIAKDDGGATALPGTNLSYTLAIANAGPSDAAGISVSDAIPAGLGFVSASGAGWTCGQAAGVVTCTRPTLAVGPAPDITLVFSVAANYAGANPILNSANVGATTTDPNPGNNTDGDTTPVGPASADLAISKSDGGASVAPGANVSYTLAVSNLGPSDAAGVSVSDPIPAGLTFVSASGAGWTCGQAAGVVSCTLPTLPVGAAAPITLVLGVPAGYAGADPIANTATVSATTADPNAGNNSGSDTTPLGAAAADLAINKSDGGASVLPGGNVSYALAVTNNGPSNAVAVSVSDTIPAGLTFVSAGGAGWTCGQAAGVVTCTLPTLAVGPAAPITLVLGVPANYAGANPIANTATVSATTADPVPGNNTGSDTTPVGNASADLAISKSDGGVSVAPGANVAYTLVITNNGPSDAAAVTVTDPTPAGTTFVSNSGDCGTPFPCALGALPAGQSRTIVATFNVGSGFPAPGTVSNTATVASTTPDTVPGNNTATDTTPVGVGSADLAVVKTGPASVVQGTNATWQMVVRNQGPSDASSVVLADPTPPGLTWVSSTAPCATGFPCNLGTLAAGASVTVSVTFAIPSPYYGAIPLVNRATVTSITPDPNPDDNTDTVTSGLGTGTRQIPVDARWALALLALLMLTVGARQARARR